MISQKTNKQDRQTESLRKLQKYPSTFGESTEIYYEIGLAQGDMLYGVWVNILNSLKTISNAEH